MISNINQIKSDEIKWNQLKPINQTSEINQYSFYTRNIQQKHEIIYFALISDFPIAFVER